jgi:N-acetylglucosaminyl-diphospho-decaprenol L-rhamnosyltransferase
MMDTARGAVPAWTVVTVTYNSAETLSACWKGFDKAYDWVVVDNNSTDDSAAVAEDLGARVVRLPANLGFSAANNIGVSHSTNPYLLFANPDLAVESDGLDRLRAHLDQYGGLAAPQLLSETGVPQPNGRGFPYVTAKLGNRNVWPFSRLHQGYRILAEPGCTVWTAWVMGAAVAARREDFLAIGGWNERFFIYYEDAEICLRAWRHGQPVAVLGDVRWAHRWARATNTLRPSRAHRYELRAARTFYGMFPEFVFGLPRPTRRHALARARCGTSVLAASGPDGVPGGPA